MPLPEAPRKPLRRRPGQHAQPNRERKRGEKQYNSDSANENAGLYVVPEPLDADLAGPVRGPGKPPCGGANQQEIKNKAYHR